MDAEGREAIHPHLTRQLITAPLRLAEDEYLGTIHDLLQEALQTAALVVVLHDLHVLPDGVGGAKIQRADVDVDGVLPAQVAGEPLHLTRPSGAPHQCLSVGSDLRDNLPHLRLEAHVQHAVRLVQHEVRDALQVGVAVLEEVDQPPGRRDDDLNTIAQITTLCRARGATVAASVLDLGAPPEAVGLLLDLNGQFARWRHHKDDGPIATREVRLRIDVHDSRQEEGQGLPRARLRDANHVAATEGDGPALDLDGRGLLEAGARDLLKHILRERGFLKGPDRLRDTAPMDDCDALRFPDALGLVRRQGSHGRVLLVEVLLKLNEAHLVPINVPQVGAQVLVVKVALAAASPGTAVTVTVRASAVVAATIPAAVAAAAVHRWCPAAANSIKRNL
mmetsp:Transcript_52496/g.162348  ORF Transcript_52496/g.162348 Transcript_52496/m.162348 type:complete len:392 (-) Transcript_52496:39-1214(-)